MKKENNKEINTEMLRESLIEYNNLAKILSESKKNAYATILAESEEDENEDNSNDFSVEQVEDTTSNEDFTEKGSDENGEAADGNAEGAEANSEDNGMESVEDEANGSENAEGGNTEGENAEDDALASDFGDFKVGEGEYDLRGAKDDDIVKVFKRLKDTDGITVVQNDNQVELNDGDNEYIIQLDGNGDSESANQDGAEVAINLQDNTDMNESTEKVFEVLIESELGYTDNYQNKDVMTTDGVKEPGNGRDIDKGVPHTDSKPWANPDKKAKPFDKGVKAECGESAEAPLEEQSIARSGKRRMKGVKSPVPDTSGQDHPYNPANKTVAGEYKGTKNSVDESKMAEAYKKVIEECKQEIAKCKQEYQNMVVENNQIKARLVEFTDKLKDAAVTSMNLGGIVKLITENSTTMEEKKQIVNRFINEAKTVTESQNLYNQIRSELKSKPQNAVNINEEKQFAAKENEAINESKLYADESLMGALGLMSRICPK